MKSRARAYHRSHLTEYVQRRQKAVIYARESGDLTLLVTCLEMLSNAFYHTGQIDESLHTYIEAERESKSTEVPGFLRGRVRSGLSLPYAQYGKSEEVVQFVDGAYATFTEPDDETPVYLRVTNGRFIIMLDEGRSILDLGNHAQKQGNVDDSFKYWKDAVEKFDKIEQFHSSVLVSVGITAEMEIGRALAYAKLGYAELHTSLDGFSSPHKRFLLDFDQLLDKPLQSLLPLLRNRPDDAAYLHWLVETLKTKLMEFPITELDYGVCHGDIHGGNVHVTQNQKVTFFDFDDCGPGWRVYDLATFRWNLLINNQDETLWQAFLQGYQQKRTIRVVFA